MLALFLVGQGPVLLWGLKEFLWNNFMQLISWIMQIQSQYYTASWEVTCGATVEMVKNCYLLLLPEIKLSLMNFGICLQGFIILTYNRWIILYSGPSVLFISVIHTTSFPELILLWVKASVSVTLHVILKLNSYFT